MYIYMYLLRCTCTYWQIMAKHAHYKSVLLYIHCKYLNLHIQNSILMYLYMYMYIYMYLLRCTNWQIMANSILMYLYMYMYMYISCIYMYWTTLRSLLQNMYLVYWQIMAINMHITSLYYYI